MKKIITCASYGGTGSSVITDILKEFKTVKSTGEYEFAIAHEIDGIANLEYNLVENWHRLNNDEALYRFVKLITNYDGTEKLFAGKFLEITREYIENITEFKWEGYYHQHTKRYNKLHAFFRYELYKKIQCKGNSIKNRLKGRSRKSHSYEFVPSFKKQTMYFSRISEEKFLNETKKYYERLFECIDEKNEYKYIAIDQLVPTSNIMRYSRYFNDINIIIVDRDPRDLYILNKKYWKEGWIPTDDLDIYINWFEKLRINRDNELKNPNVELIQFEKLVYNYDKEIKKLYKLLNLKEEDHIKKKKFFNPEVSKNNTKLWIKNTEYKEEVDKIKIRLKKYCYLDEE